MKKIIIVMFVGGLFLTGCAGPLQVFQTKPPLSCYTAGKSVQNRPIKYYVVGTGSDAILFIAAIHGNEPAGTPLLYKMADYLREHPGFLEGRKVVLVPVVNPDGVALNTRFNANGVDINRNFPAVNRTNNAEYGLTPLSEPETQIIDNLIRQYKPIRIISLHQPSHPDVGWVDYDGPAQELAGRIADFSLLPLRKYGTFPGSLGAYAGETLSIPIVTFEQPLETNAYDSRWSWRLYDMALLSAIVYPNTLQYEDIQ